MNNKKQRGEELLRRMLGDEYADRLAVDITNESFGVFFRQHSIDSCFGSIWARPGLDLRSRSLATIGMLIAVGDRASLKNHFLIGMRNGLTPLEIEEIVYQAIPYLGYPTAGVAITVLQEVLEEKRKP